MILTLLLAAMNLLPNGNLDEGTGHPLHWERPNGLTTFIVQEEGRGQVVKMDSRPERTQVLEYLKALKNDPNAAPPQPQFAKAPFYSAIGGNEGVQFDSETIPVKPGQDYKLSVDVRGNSKPFVWIKGFRKHPKRDMLIDSYQTRLHAYPLSETEWKTFSIGFNPTAKSPHTEIMKVRLYVYWPVGVCQFDNLRIEEITPEEMQDLKKKREE